MNFRTFHITRASRLTFQNKYFRAMYVILALLFFGGMFVIPVRAIPGNDITFQAQLYGWGDYAVLGVLSLFSALVITFQVNIWTMGFGTLKQRAGHTAVSSVGILSGVTSSIFASATCGLCAGALFSFLGAGGVMFLVVYRWYIFTLALAMLLLSLYLLSRRINNGCEACFIAKK